MGSSRVTSPTRPLSPAQVEARLEAAIQATVALAPPTLGQTAGIPIFGTFPRPGHTYPALPSPSIVLAQHLFSR